MLISSIRKAHKNNLSDSENIVLEHLSDNLSSLSKEAVQLAIQLKETSNKVEQLIKHVNGPPPNKIRVCPKAPIMEGFAKANRSENSIVEGRIAESHAVPTSAYWAFE